MRVSVTLVCTVVIILFREQKYQTKVYLHLILTEIDK